MDRHISKGVAIHQTTGIRLIVGIVLDDFSLKDAEENFIEGQTVSLGLFVGVISNPYPVMAYRVNNIFNPHGLPFTIPHYSMSMHRMCRPSSQLPQPRPVDAHPLIRSRRIR
jgi:hypothetical protein